MEKFVFDDIKKRLQERFPNEYSMGKKFSFDGKTDCGFQGKEKYVLVETDTDWWVSKSVDSIGQSVIRDLNALLKILNGVCSNSVQLHNI